MNSLDKKVPPYGIRKSIHLEFKEVCDNLGLKRSTVLETLAEQFIKDTKQTSLKMKITNNDNCKKCKYDELQGGFRMKVIECEKCKTKTLKDHIFAQGRSITWMAHKLGMSQPLLSMQLTGASTMKEETLNAIIDMLGIDKKYIKDKNSLL